MIDKDEIKKMIDNKNFENVFKIFYQEYLEKLKKILEKNNITYNEKMTLIDIIMLVDAKIQNSELITHTPMETIFMENRDPESRANYAINWYDRWISNVQNMLNI